MRLFSLITTLSLCSSIACAQPIQTRAELEGILDDQILLEDFESASVHGGTSIAVPNPFNTNTFPAGLEISGISYASTLDDLALYGGFLDGDENVILRTHGDFTITFDNPQLAGGFDLINTLGQDAHSFHISVMSLDLEVDAWDVNLPARGVAFIGYQSPDRAITHFVVTHDGSAYPSLNCVAFGVNLGLVVCPADLNSDGTLNFFDVSVFLSAFSAQGPAADFTGDGQYNFFDVSAFLGAFTQGCP